MKHIIERVMGDDLVASFTRLSLVVLTGLLVVLVVFFVEISIDRDESSVEELDEVYDSLEEVIEEQVGLEGEIDDIREGQDSLEEVIEEDVIQRLDDIDRKLEDRGGRDNTSDSEEDEDEVTVESGQSHQSISTVNCNVGTVSDLSAEDVNQILEGTPIEGEGDVVVKYEREYEVNAWLILGLSAHESGNWSSSLARNRHNYFGWRAYDGATHNATYFDSFADCLDEVIPSIRSNYIDQGLNTLASMNTRYATDPSWAQKVLNNINSLRSRLD